MDSEFRYHRARVWQIGLFALNNTAVNLYYMMMLYISYYAAGVLGLTVAVVSTLLAGLNILDGITDPIIGWIIDRTSGRFGKFRPFMLAGNLVLIGVLALMALCRLAPEAARLPFLIICFIIYDVGYTLQFDVTRAAQAALTNDPKQRPVFSAFDMVLNVILYVGVSMLVTNYLVPKHGDFTEGLFMELFVITAAASLACTVLAVVGIAGKDKPEFYAPLGRQDKPKLRDLWGVLRCNRNVRMLILCAGSDKLFSNITTNATVTIILFGIVCGDYALAGQTNMYVFAPSIIISLLCVAYARRKGQKRALLLGTYGAICANFVIFFLFVFGDPRSLNFGAWGAFTIAFLAALAVRGGFMSVNNSIIVPMIGDCADDETRRGGKSIPGMIGGLFSLTDKLVTSLNSVIVGGLVIAIGFREMFPTVNTPYSNDLFTVAMICYCGLPLVGWIINILALKRYDLTPARMEAIQKDLASNAPCGGAHTAAHIGCPDPAPQPVRNNRV
jgi:Na+/melibiose symporter-like transporter